MKKFKFLILIIILIFSPVFASDIQIDNFDELIDSTAVNGDILTFTNNLDSTSSIGDTFENLSITFEGNDHFLDGNNLFSGFVFNQETEFNRVGVRHCKGQSFNNSSFAGALYNNGGEIRILEAAFADNFVDSNNLNYGVGGALYNLNGGNVIIDTALFENNYANGAASYGGAIANGYQQSNDIMTINNSIFRNNYAEGSVIPYGGAIYNNGKVDIANSTFDNNYIQGEESMVSYGGALFNTGEMSISNCNITNNYGDGGANTVTRGGAIYNNNQLTIDNSTLAGNHIDAQFYGDGGALFNDAGGVATIKNSIIENNSVNSTSGQTDGGGAANSGTLIIENSTFRNNSDTEGANDIHNYSGGIIEFAGDGTTNILSGIDGEGTINKTGSGILNLGGTNNNYTGSLKLEAGTINLLKDSTYFNAQNTSLYNNTNFNMLNGEINNINFGNLSLAGTSNIFADVNFNTNTMDRINANSLAGSGNIHVAALGLEGTPQGNFISIPFADSILRNSVTYTPTEIQTPIYDYNSSYNSSNGNFEFSRGGFNSSVYVPAVAAQLAGYFTELETYKNVFSNLDMVMITPPDRRTSLQFRNKIASKGGNFAYSPLLMPEQRRGVWFKPYTMFEKVQLRGGVDVSNVSYGSLFGVESGLTELKHGWYSLYGGYASYNGSHQAFSGNSIYNNGGLAGAYGVFYKGGFFSAWTANAGANSAEASTRFGKDNFAMLNAGIAEKTGYNFETFRRKLIIQPSLMMSYTFVNTFNYTTSAGVHMDADPLHAIHIEPQIKLIGNFKNYLQPYLSVSMIWNILDDTKFKASDIYIPDLSVKPYVQYGLGVQKRWGERITAFFETMFRNGGRNGVALQFGIRFSI